MMKESLPKLISRWLVHLEEQGKSPHTIRGYATDLRDFSRWFHNSYGEELYVGAVLPRDVEDYKAYLQTVRRLAPRTINRRLAALSRFFKWTVDRDLTHRDPTTQIRGARVAERKPKALDRKDERRLLREIQRAGNLRDLAIVEIMLATGIRVGELLTLRRGDIVLGDRSGRLIVRRGKGGVGRRIPLKAKARRVLQDYLNDLGQHLGDKDPLWYGQRGALQDSGGIARMLDKYALRAGIEGVSPHVLRHTFATRYLEANPDDLRGLASLLGHASLDTVMIYTEPTEEDLLERLEGMDKG